MEASKSGGEHFDFESFTRYYDPDEVASDVMWRLLAEKRGGRDWRETIATCDPLRLPDFGEYDGQLLFVRLEADHSIETILQKEDPEDEDSDFLETRESTHEMGLCIEEELDDYCKPDALGMIVQSHIEETIIDAIDSGEIDADYDQVDEIAATTDLLEDDDDLEWLQEQGEDLSLRIGERYKVYSSGGMSIERYRVAQDGETRVEVPVHSSELVEDELMRTQFISTDLHRIAIGCRIFKASPKVMNALEKWGVILEA